MIFFKNVRHGLTTTALSVEVVLTTVTLHHFGQYTARTTPVDLGAPSSQLSECLPVRAGMARFSSSALWA